MKGPVRADKSRGLAKFTLASTIPNAAGRDQRPQSQAFAKRSN